MPTYAYRCRECTGTFELNRPMSESSAPARCPEGHDDTVKLLTTVALTGSASSGAGFPRGAGMGAGMAGAGGGCCGGACGCG